MLISMPTGTSTIFGVFQLIRVSPKQCWHDVRAGTKIRLTSNVAQARTTDVDGIPTHPRRKLPSWAKPLRSWTRRANESDRSTHASHRPRFADPTGLRQPSRRRKLRSECRRAGRSADNPTSPQLHASAILVCGFPVSFGAVGL